MSFGGSDWPTSHMHMPLGIIQKFRPRLFRNFEDCAERGAECFSGFEWNGSGAPSNEGLQQLYLDELFAGSELEELGGSEA
jgi:hypothetical protein